MSKGLYYSIQAVVSLVITSLNWYMTLNFMDVALFDIDAFGIVVTDATKSPFYMFMIGMAFYFVVTVIYIIIGAKKVQGWKPTVIIGSFVIHILMFIGGLFVPSLLAYFNNELGAIPEKIEDIFGAFTRF